MKTKLAIAVAVFQVLVLAYLAGEREWVFRTGRTIFLRSAPLDPRDVMRGDYVRINYDISRVPRALCRGELGSTNRTFESVRRDTRVYAALRTNETGVAELVGLSLERPASGLFISGRTEGSWGGMLQVRYGIEAYFTQQGHAARLEESVARDAIRVPLDMEVALSSSGVAVLKDYRRSALGIGLSLEMSPGVTNRNARSSSEPAAESPLAWQRPRRPIAATVRLFNASSNNLAVVDLPGGRSLALVPDLRWGPNPWHWSYEADPPPPVAPADVVLLRPGESRSIRISFDDPYWSVWKESPAPRSPREPVRLLDLTNDWSARFYLEYRPPDATSSANLPHAVQLWHGRLPTRGLTPVGNLD